MARRMALVVVAGAIVVVSSACGGSRTGASSSPPSRSITVRCAENLQGSNPSGHATSGRGHCTISGTINDTGTVTDSRTQKGNVGTVRRVVVGRRGAITFVIKIDVTSGSETWTIASATKAYRRLHGSGRQVVDAYSETPARFVMKGTVQPPP